MTFDSASAKQFFRAIGQNAFHDTAIKMNLLLTLIAFALFADT